MHQFELTYRVRDIVNRVLRPITIISPFCTQGKYASDNNSSSFLNNLQSSGEKRVRFELSPEGVSNHHTPTSTTPPPPGFQKSNNVELIQQHLNALLDNSIEQSNARARDTSGHVTGYVPDIGCFGIQTYGGMPAFQTAKNYDYNSEGKFSPLLF